MKILLEDIPDSGLTVDVEDQAVELEAIQKRVGAEDFKFVSPVILHLEILLTGPDVNVSGSMNTELQFACGRCLKEFIKKVDAGFNVFYTRQGEDAREKELKPGEIDVNLLDSNELDTTEIAFAQIALEAPIKPLCNEDCSGLCPGCGEDLNSGKCRCAAHETVDRRFAGLKDFKVKKQ